MESFDENLLDLFNLSDEESTLLGNPVLSEASNKNLLTSSPNTSLSQVDYLSGMGLGKGNKGGVGGSGTTEATPGLAEDIGLNFRAYVLPDTTEPTLAMVNSNVQLTPNDDWVDRSTLQPTTTHEVPPAVPNYTGGYDEAMGMEAGGLQQVNDEMVVQIEVPPEVADMILSASTSNPNMAPEDILQSAIDSVANLPSTTAATFTSSSGDDQSATSFNNGEPSSFGKCKSSRKQKKKFLHEDPNKDDPYVRRAAGAKDYRERKKQATEELVKNLQQQLADKIAEVASLKQTIEANDAMSRETTVKLMESIACTVRAAGGGDVIVTSQLANKQGAKLTEELIQQITQDASLSNPSKRFRLVFHMEDQGQLIAEKLD